MGIPDFESSAFGHSANLPLTKTQIKCRKSNAENQLQGLKFSFLTHRKGNTIFLYNKEKSKYVQNLYNFYADQKLLNINVLVIGFKMKTRLFKRKFC